MESSISCRRPHLCTAHMPETCHSKMQNQATTQVFYCNCFNLHWCTVTLMNPSSPPQQTLQFCISLCWCSHILQDKLQMTGDIQWTAAGGNIQAQHAQAERKINCSYYSYVHFHTSSTNGVLMRCPLADMVFLPSTNFFAACKENREQIHWRAVFPNISQYL